MIEEVSFLAGPFLLIVLVGGTYLFDLLLKQKRRVQASSLAPKGMVRVIEISPIIGKRRCVGDFPNLEVAIVDVHKTSTRNLRGQVLICNDHEEICLMEA